MQWLYEEKRIPRNVSSTNIADIMRSMSRDDFQSDNCKWLAPYVLADIYGKPREYRDHFKALSHFVFNDDIACYLAYHCIVRKMVTDKFPADLAIIIAVYQSEELVL